MWWAVTTVAVQPQYRSSMCSSDLCGERPPHTVCPPASHLTPFRSLHYVQASWLFSAGAAKLSGRFWLSYLDRCVCSLSFCMKEKAKKVFCGDYRKYKPSGFVDNRFMHRCIVKIKCPMRPVIFNALHNLLCCLQWHRSGSTFLLHVKNIKWKVKQHMRRLSWVNGCMNIEGFAE